MVWLESDDSIFVELRYTNNNVFLPVSMINRSFFSFIGRVDGALTQIWLMLNLLASLETGLGIAP